MKKALALISGGLDSILAAKIIKNQGVQVEGINFFIGFSGDTPSELEDKIPSSLQSHTAKKVTEALGIKLHVIDAVSEFKKVMQLPQFGYGANLNPCLDCKCFMVNYAKNLLPKLGADFLVSGEVMGQRPKSQRKDTLPIVAKNCDGLLLRPLSAKLLPITAVEEQGWVQRESLYAIHGRSRKEQMELAKQLGVTHYPQPAGGCILTDSIFCTRFCDSIGCCKCGAEESKTKGISNYTLDDICLARLGRHLNISSKLKLIVGRDEKDNAALEFYAKTYPLLSACDYPGASVLLFERMPTKHSTIGGDDNLDAAMEKQMPLSSSSLDQQTLELAARITAKFSKGKNQPTVHVQVTYPGGEAKVLSVSPLPENEIRQEWYVG